MNALLVGPLRGPGTLAVSSGGLVAAGGVGCVLLGREATGVGRDGEGMRWVGAVRVPDGGMGISKVVVVVWLSHAGVSGEGEEGREVLCVGDERGGVCVLEVNGDQGKVIASGGKHEGAVTAATGSTSVLVTAGSDAVVRIWRMKEADGLLELMQSIVTPKPMLCLALTEVGMDRGKRGDERKTTLLLAAGGCSHPITLFTCEASPSGIEGNTKEGGSNGDNGFTPCCTLTGHTDWVRALAFHEINQSLMLASGGQDRHIRLWSIKRESVEGPSSSLRRLLPSPRFHLHGEEVKVVTEALLSGHEDWVYGLQWRCAGGGGGETNGASLISASMDRTIIFWRPSGSGEGGGDVWMAEASVGDTSLANLGFYAASWSADGRRLLAHSYTGGVHAWRRSMERRVEEEADEVQEGEEEEEAADRARELGMRWEQVPALSGHWAPVIDIYWAFRGRCLLSVGEDETTRVFAEWGDAWREIARPQVHGHGLACIASIEGVPRSAPSSSSSPSCPPPFQIVTGAEEKVLRVFQAPEAFLQTLAACCEANGDEEGVALCHELMAGAAFGACVPALGLSNKPVNVQGEKNDAKNHAGGGGAVFNYEDGPDVAPVAHPATKDSPPTEEHLCGSTLWPETRKLYGHGNDIYTCAPSHCGTLLATACHSQTPDAAAVWVWEADTWRPIGMLQGHTLTVTQLEFSPREGGGRVLLSVSRDRSLCIFVGEDPGGGRRRNVGTEKKEGEGTSQNMEEPTPFRLLCRVPKAHARIIWGCSWSPCGSFFATASRDKSLKVWLLDLIDNEAETSDEKERNTCVQCVYTMPVFKSAVTSVAWGPAVTGGGGSPSESCSLLAVGLEEGDIYIYLISASERAVSAREVSRIEHPHCHFSTVRRLRWRPVDILGSAFTLASCGNDHAVRIHRLMLDGLRRAAS